jgi:hypothetical protein
VMQSKEIKTVCHMLVQICEKVYLLSEMRYEVSDYWKKG